MGTLADSWVSYQKLRTFVILTMAFLIAPIHTTLISNTSATLSLVQPFPTNYTNVTKLTVSFHKVLKLASVITSHTPRGYGEPDQKLDQKAVYETTRGLDNDALLFAFYNHGLKGKGSRAFLPRPMDQSQSAANKLEVALNNHAVSRASTSQQTHARGDMSWNVGPPIQLTLAIIMSSLLDNNPFYFDDAFPDVAVRLIDEKSDDHIAPKVPKPSDGGNTTKVCECPDSDKSVTSTPRSVVIHRRHDAVKPSGQTVPSKGQFKKDTKLNDTLSADYHPILMAIQRVAKYPNLLEGYTLNMDTKTSKCNAAKGTKVFFDMMYNPPPKLMLFGGACTQVTAPIAEASPFWNLVQVSYAEMHPKFSSRQTYPNFYRTVPSLNDYNAAGIHLLKLFNWTKVGTIFQDDPRYSLPHNDFLNKLDSNDFNIAVSRSFNTPEKLHEIIKELKERDIRIIVTYFNETMAHYAFCYIYLESYYGAKYQWVMLGGMVDIWLNVEILNLPCARGDMLTALEHTLRIDILSLSTSAEKTISGYTSAQYMEEYNKLRGNSYSRFHGYAYDGIWAIALALNYAFKKLNKDGSLNLSLVNFNYESEAWSRLFKEALNATNFIGVTGRVKFQNGNRLGLLKVKQMQGQQEVKIAEYDGIKDYMTFINVSNVTWAGKGPPIASPKIVYTTVRISIIMYLIISGLAILGIILACVFLFVNIRYRNQRYVKMSSPLLNNVIILGGILAYVSIIILGCDSIFTSIGTFSHICMAKIWILSLSFTLAFGAMFSKTWRVHAIFTNVKLNKKIIQDYKLFIMIGVLLSIDMIILTAWTIFDPFSRKSETLPTKVSQTNSDIERVYVIEHCTSIYMNIWLGVLCAYKGLLMLFGCFLAWETRHVTIPALNDSKYIGISVYNIMILCIMGAAVSIVLKNEQSTSFLLISIFIMLGTTITLCLVFVPKLIQLKNIYSGGGEKEKSTYNRPHFKEKDKYHDFKKKVTKLVEDKHKNKKTLEEKTKKLIALLHELGMEVDEQVRIPVTPESTKKSDTSPPLLRGGDNLTVEQWPVKIEGKKLYVQPKPSIFPSSSEYTEAFELTDINDINNGGDLMTKRQLSVNALYNNNVNAKPKNGGKQITIDYSLPSVKL